MKNEATFWLRLSLLLLLTGGLVLTGCSSVSWGVFKEAQAIVKEVDKTYNDPSVNTEEEVPLNEGEEEDELPDQSTEEESEESDSGNQDSTGGFIELPPTQESNPPQTSETPEPAPPGTPIRTFYELSGSPPTAPGLAMKHRFFKEEPEKIVYLTIDDGPSENTLPILEILRKEEVKATFFVIGSQVEKYPDILRMTHAEGHAIGNHTYSHNYSEIYQSPEAFVANLKKSEELLYKLIGIRPKVIRTPGGTHGNFSVSFYNAVDKEDYLVYDWNVSTEDATAPLVPTENLIQNVKRQVPGKDRIIMLMHDAPGKWTTVEALPHIIQYLKEEGYEFGVLTPEVAPILFPGGFYS